MHWGDVGSPVSSDQPAERVTERCLFRPVTASGADEIHLRSQRDVSAARMPG